MREDQKFFFFVPSSLSITIDVIYRPCALPYRNRNSPRASGIMMATNSSSQPTCQNCTTSTTPLWRRDEFGSVLCNACGLFLKLHGRPRPISLKTDVIKSRNRVKTIRPDLSAKRKVCYHLCFSCLLFGTDHFSNIVLCFTATATTGS